MHRSFGSRLLPESLYSILYVFNVFKCNIPHGRNDAALQEHFQRIIHNRDDFILYLYFFLGF